MTIVKNTDKELVKEIEEAIKKNDGYCCCAIEKTPDTKCICKEFLNRQSLGPCHCGRYIKTAL